MKAIICDRCGKQVNDRGDDEEELIRSIHLEYSSSHSGNIGNWDLCNSCRNNLFEFLKPLKLSDILMYPEGVK